MEVATGTFVAGAFGGSVFCVFCATDTGTVFAVVFGASAFCGTDTGSVFSVSFLLCAGREVSEVMGVTEVSGVSFGNE